MPANVLKTMPVYINQLKRILACWRPPSLAAGALTLRHRVLLLWWLTAGASLVTLATAHGQNLAALEQQAVQAAVAQVAPSVVAIQTLGGQEKVGQLLVGTGPTTGLIVSADGYIISSKFNFRQQPASILVRLPHGPRVAAKVVAHDHARMLTLLKVDAERPLPVPIPAPQESWQVGQWAIAVGRTAAEGGLHMSAGIVSALKRLQGRVLQTDAKISPNNYGGPLINIHGQVLGILVPMSPQSEETVAGVEWYDSGIGFAVPLSDINRKLDLLKSSQDLHRGLLGIGLQKGDPYTSPAKISAVKPRSPAQAAKLETGDQIAAVDGQPIATQTQLQLALGHRYAGETVTLDILRNDQRLTRQVKLADHIDATEHGFLGILPSRSLQDGNTPGVAVRYVYPNSPASLAGIQPGDQILTIGDQPIGSPSEAVATMGSFFPGDKVAISIKQPETSRSLDLIASKLPTDIPPALPLAHDPLESAKKPNPLPVGIQEIRIPEFKNRANVYIPSSYDPRLAYGLVIWLHGPHGNPGNQTLQQWQPWCDQHDLIIVAPESAKAGQWNLAEIEYLRKVLDHATAAYQIDPLRVVAYGYQSGGAMAYLLSWKDRERIRAVAAIDAPTPSLGKVPENAPLQRLAVLTTEAQQSRFKTRITRGIKALQTARYPVTVLSLGEKPRRLNAMELEQLVRWIDTLDRF